MIIHISRQRFGEEFLVAKITKDVFDDEKVSHYCLSKLESYFHLPIYLFCEETRCGDTTKGDKESICGYIKYCEARLDFDILEID